MILRTLKTKNYQKVNRWINPSDKSTIVWDFNSKKWVYLVLCSSDTLAKHKFLMIKVLNQNICFLYLKIS